MPLVDVTTPPSARTQRWFGLSLAALLGLVGFAVGHAAAGSSGWPQVARTTLWGIAALLAAVYYLVPRSQIIIIRLWQYLTLPLAWTIGHALMLLAYFGVFLPIGLLLRLSGHDPLKLRARDTDSEWIARTKPESVARYFRQY